MKFFSFKRTLYPLIAFLSGLFIIVFGLVTAKSTECSYFLLAVFCLLMIFGCHKACLHVLPMLILVGGIFFVIFYFATGRWISALSMFNRFAALFLAMVPGMSISTVAMTRNLSALRAPRAVTLGILISMSFMPMLRGEVNRVREAMKTRGAGSLWNPKIFYRALLVPLVMRLVNISDTLALSVETRGFSLRKVSYTIYKKENIAVSDVLYAVILIACAVLSVVL